MKTTREKELDALKQAYEKAIPPADGLERLETVMKQAQKDRQKKKRTAILRRAGLAAAAALALFIILPNTGAGVARAMEKIPVIGGLVKVVTFNRYDYEDENHEAHVEVPRLEVQGGQPEGGTDAEQVNIDIRQFAEEKMEAFQEELPDTAVKGLHISYDVVTDTEDWFALRMNILEVMASGYEQRRFYNIDKRTGREMQLKDLFAPDAGYVSVISEEIKKQMRERMAADEGQLYFLDDPDMEDGFQAISTGQNYYINSEGKIVIAFDEYEVAPGYMGVQEFVMPDEALAQIRIR